MVMSKPTIFYNGACPICRREIDHYRTLDQHDQAALAWCDISQDPERLRSAGLTEAEAKRRLHVQGADGAITAGLPAFLAIWTALQRYRGLARMARLPGIRHGLALAYEPIAWMLFRWDQCRSRRSKA